MSTLPSCPKCQSEYTYQDGDMFICPDCAHEWSASEPAEAASEARVWKDAHGNVLQDGDAVTLIKDLKVKGAGQTLKRGTVIRSIRLTGDDQAGRQPPPLPRLPVVGDMRFLVHLVADPVPHELPDD